MDIQAQVLEAASTLVAAFAANDSEAYFAIFRRAHENAPWLTCHEHLSAMPQPLPPT